MLKIKEEAKAKDTAFGDMKISDIALIIGDNAWTGKLVFRADEDRYYLLDGSDDWENGQGLSVPVRILARGTTFVLL